jgi:hypothetical protein
VWIHVLTHSRHESCNSSRLHGAAVWLVFTWIWGPFSKVFFKAIKKQLGLSLHREDKPHRPHVLTLSLSDCLPVCGDLVLISAELSHRSWWPPFPSPETLKAPSLLNTDLQFWVMSTFMMGIAAVASTDSGFRLLHVLPVPDLLF